MLVPWRVVILIYHEQQVFQISNPKSPLGIRTWTSVASASWMQQVSRFQGELDVNPVFCLGVKCLRKVIPTYCCMIKSCKETQVFMNLGLPEMLMMQFVTHLRESFFYPWATSS